MSIINNIESFDILLYCNIKYCNNVVYFSLHFSNAGIIVIKSNNLITVRESLISLFIQKKHKNIKLDDKCGKEIQKLQALFKEACAYELKISFHKKNIDT